MKKIPIILLLLSAIKMFACSCDTPYPSIEFHNSKYVFEGEITSKNYSKDSLKYEIIFNILKHYKKGDSPKILKFDLKAEGKYTGELTSCDWKAEKGQKWLVYADEYKNQLYFSGICSNSTKIGHRNISPKKQKMLDNGNIFEFNNYVFEYEHGFNYCENITDINPILKKGKKKNYKKKITILNVLIDSDGNLKSVFRNKEVIRKKDSVFNLNTMIEESNKIPITDFEKEAIQLIKQVKKWEIKKANNTNISVNYMRHIWIHYNSDKNEWSYDL